MNRQTTGIPDLDALLGGGLLPGTLTVVLGASGIGKTQLGVCFANQGLHQEGERGIIFDLTSRGDSQNHSDYAKRITDWELSAKAHAGRPDLSNLWNRQHSRSDYMNVFQHSGRRVTSTDLSTDDWREWQYEQAKKIDQSIAFFYGNFVHGVRRTVIDGVEPVERASESIQFEMFEYVYHQILRKEHDWVARDLFRVDYRSNEQTITKHAYQYGEIGCMLLYTSHEVMLDDLLTRPIETGDVLSNANTIILMGKTRDGNKMGRAIHVAKHRGSACDESIVPFTIEQSGIKLA